MSGIICIAFKDPTSQAIGVPNALVFSIANSTANWSTWCPCIHCNVWTAFQTEMGQPPLFEVASKHCCQSRPWQHAKAGGKISYELVFSFMVFFGRVAHWWQTKFKHIRTQMMPRVPIPASDSKSIGFCRPGSGSMYCKSSLIAGKFAYLNIRVISACPANTSTKLNLESSWKGLPETTDLGRVVLFIWLEPS